MHKCMVLIDDRLVATLGSKSTLKKVGRKKILDVNISRACQTVISHQVPMALRLQSNLLLVIYSTATLIDVPLAH